MTRRYLPESVSGVKYIIPQYYLSATAGAICPIADLSAGMLPSSLGFAISTTVLNVDITTAAAVL